MFELAVRVVLGAVLMGVSGLAGKPDFDLAVKVAAFTATMAFVVFQIDRKGLRNPGISGFIAVADAGLISAVAASAGLLDSFGFLVLGPCVYATARFGASASAMAPMAAGWLLVTNNLFGGGEPTPQLLVQSVAVLGLGLAQGLIAPVAKAVPEEPQIETFLPEEPSQDQIDPSTGQIIELRESYRRLRDSYSDLERKSRKDRLAVALFEAANGSGPSLHQRIAKKLLEITGAEGLTIYSAASLADMLVVQAASGDIPDAIATASFETPKGMSDGQTRHKLDLQLRALRPEDRKQRYATVLLKDRGKLIGMICLTHSHPSKLDEAMRRAEDSAPFVASMMRESAEQEAMRRRLKESDLLYTVATTVFGAETPISLSARVVRELNDILGLDSLSLFMIDGDSSIQASAVGNPKRVLESMSFANGPGLAGWIATKSPEVWIPDSAQDDRLPREEAMRQRIGSLAILPIQFDEAPFGYLVATQRQAGGIDLEELESLRIVTAELGAAFARLQGASDSIEGLANPREFQQHLSKEEFGFMVYLEPIRKDEMIETYGRPAFEHAVRKFATRIRAKLPAGAVVTRRPEGDFVAFLRTDNEEYAKHWANEVSAIASLIGIRTPDGRSRIPFAVRAKTAEWTRQNYQILAENAA